MSFLPKKVMIDARIVQAHAYHGIARYVWELVHGLVAQGADPQDLRKSTTSVEWILLVNSDSALLKSPALQKPHVHFCIMKSRWMSFVGQYELWKKIRSFKPHLFHAPSFFVPLFCPRTPLIVTLHDMNHVALSTHYSWKQKIYYEFFLKRRLKKNAHILTVSEFSKQEIVRYMEIPAASITTTYNGVSAVFRPLEGAEELRQREAIWQKFHLPSSYILALGNEKPHKNLHNTLRAYQALKLSLPLVVITNDAQSLSQWVQQNAPGRAIHILSQIAEEELPLIYSGAKLFVYFSLYEGFGLPVLEAMSCGVAVATSNTTSLPEVVGPHALYADPHCIEDMSRVLAQAVEHPPTEAFLTAARLHAKRYSWETLVSQTYDVYCKCICNPHKN